MEKQIALMGELARRKLKPFVSMFWGTIEPTPFVDGWYFDAIAEHLEALASRQINKLIINLPPRHTKSLLTDFFRAWKWATNPEERFLASSYSLALSTRDNVKVRRIVESPLYQQLYGVQIVEDQNQKHKFQTDKGGYSLATSVESSNLGEGADCLILDDVNNISDIHSPAERARVLTWYNSVMSTRLNPFGNGATLLVQQRCHEEDLSGHLIANDEQGNWCKLILPYEFEKARNKPTSLGWTDPRRDEGELLSNAVPDVKERKKNMGSLMWSAQYQQNPWPADGAVFKSSWFKYHSPGPDYVLGSRRFAPDVCRRFATCDLAISTKKEADYTVLQVFDVTPDSDLILLHCIRKRMVGTQILPTMKAIAETYKPAYFVVEDVAFQRLVIEDARKQGLTVKAYKPEHDKLTRSLPLQVRMEAGQVWFPESAPWLEGLERELLGFPAGVHDDMVDALSMAAIEVNRAKDVKVFLSEPKKEAPPIPKTTILQWSDVERLREEYRQKLAG
jgi:predicted phage terminase large subunit-like protein